MARRPFDRASRDQRARLERAFAQDPNLEQELAALIDALPSRRREDFERAFLLALGRVERPAAAVGAALVGLIESLTGDGGRAEGGAPNGGGVEDR